MTEGGKRLILCKSKLESKALFKNQAPSMEINIQKLIEIDYVFCDLYCPIQFRDSTVEFYGELQKKCMNFQCDSSISLELCGVIVAIGCKKAVMC